MSLSNNFRAGPSMCTTRQSSAQRRCRGISLLECIILVVTLSIVGAAAGIGLQSVSRVPDDIEIRLWTESQIVSAVENLRDKSYASIVSATATSDPDRTGATYTITTTVTEIDPNKPTNSPAVTKANSGLKQIVVSMNNQSMTTWISQ